MTSTFRAAASATLIATVLMIAAPAHAQSNEPASPANTPMPAFRQLFTDLPADLRRLPTTSNSLWLGATGALALAVHSKDSTITEHAFGSLGLETALDGGASIGGGLVQGGAALGTFLVGRLSHRPAVAIVGADLVRAQIINTALTQGIKLSVNRTRPDGAPFSFPSGHSSSAFATATVLQRHFGWKAGIPAYAMATYVASSRLTENKHFLSDVIFGAGIGIVSGRAVTVGRGSERFAIGPTLVHGGVGVNFTRLNPR
jgi:membrane-associated phospholipid phosphatase